MKKQITLLATSLALALFTFQGCADKEANVKTETKHTTTHKAHWGYTGHGNPSEWGQLSAKYSMCSEGRNQSPIDITVQDSADVNLQALAFSYTTNSKNVVNNGHTIQVNIAPGSTIMIDGKTFELKQFHFHTPSENHIGGKSFPLEAHFVHLDKDGDIAVISVMFEEGAANNALATIWNKIPTTIDDKKALVLSSTDINALLPKNRAYYRFNGSLTTPPCSEGVRWFVMKKPLTVSKEQVEKFLHTLHHANNRPIQNINARKVLY